MIESRTAAPATKLATIAVSECLLGRRVRWDGTDNGDAWPRQRIMELFHCVPLCPEVGIGLGVPRPPIQLVGDVAAPRAVRVDAPDIDVTERLVEYARKVSPTLTGVSGYVFADRSPSCGLAGVKVFGAGGYRRVGRGIYATAVLADRPGMPCVEAEALNCERTYAEFVDAVAQFAGC